MWDAIKHKPGWTVQEGRVYVENAAGAFASMMESRQAREVEPLGSKSSRGRRPGVHHSETSMRE